MALRWVLGAAAVVGIAEPRAFAGNVVKAGSSQVSSSGEGMKVIGYFTNWAQYRPGDGQFFPEDMDGTKLTHASYAFARVTLDYEVEPFEWNDVNSWNPDEGLYKRFHKHLRSQNPDIKTMISLGGWNFGSTIFSPMVRSAANRAKFIQSAIAFVRLHTFDGLDMDWEYPKAQDKENYALLITELREAINAEARSTGQPAILLSLAVPAGESKIDAGFDVAPLAAAADWFGVMAYDLHGSWERVTGAHSALYSASASDTLTASYAMKAWETRGVPASKLVMGMAAYGRGWTLYSASSHGMGAQAKGASTAGTYTREAGFLAWPEIQAMLKNTTGSVEKFDYVTETNYAVAGDQWVGYDTPTTLEIKARFVKERSYAGAMLWACDLDDFSNGYPLLSVIYNELMDNNSEQ